MQNNTQLYKQILENHLGEEVTIGSEVYKILGGATGTSYQQGDEFTPPEGELFVECEHVMEGDLKKFPAKRVASALGIMN